MRVKEAKGATPGDLGKVTASSGGGWYTVKLTNGDEVKVRNGDDYRTLVPRRLFDEAVQPPPTLEPPTDVHVTGEYDAQSGKAIAHVSWRAAAVEPCTRGDYLLKYTCIDTDATRSVVVSAAAESATIRGLTPGQVYSFLLIARANGVVDTPAPSVPCAMPNRPSTQPSSVSELPTSEATGPPAREKLCPRARRADASSELEAVLVAVAAGVRQPTN